MMPQIATLVLVIILGLCPTAALAGAVSRSLWPKRGLCFNDVNMVKFWNAPNSQVNWAYNWASTTADLPSYLEYVPMLWGNAPEHTSSWIENANYYLSTGSRHLLSFNEPDSTNQANLSPEDAVDAYKQWLMPFASRASLGAPAVTNGPSGLLWLESFINLCGGCKIDFVPIHWYAQTSEVTYFMNYIAQAHNAAGGRTIWITEFHASGTVQEQETFLYAVIPWLDQQPYIYRYAWFMADPNENPGPIVNTDGSPTPLGNLYGYQAY